MRRVGTEESVPWGFQTANDGGEKGGDRLLCPPQRVGVSGGCVVLGQRSQSPEFSKDVIEVVGGVLLHRFSLLLLVCLPVAGQTWIAPLTPDGQPDLQGTWRDSSATPLERPKALEGRQFLTDAEVEQMKQNAARLFRSGGANDFAANDAVFMAALANPREFKSPTATSGADAMIDREFDNRTSLIVDPPDGRIPPLTAAGRQRQAERPAALGAGLRPPARVEDLNSAIRCITAGVPRLGGRYGAGDFGYYQIFQAPGFVVLFSEVIHEARIIPLDGSPHLPAGVREWMGDSRGHWEGKTLVVDTTNFSPEADYLGSAENLHLVERFTRIAAGEIRYEITVDDATTWTRPWSAMIRLRQTEEPIYEFACHEDNSPMVGILTGARAEDVARQNSK